MYENQITLPYYRPLLLSADVSHVSFGDQVRTVTLCHHDRVGLYLKVDQIMHSIPRLWYAEIALGMIGYIVC
jgi:hypothetical protein